MAVASKTEEQKSDLAITDRLIVLINSLGLYHSLLGFLTGPMTHLLVHIILNEANIFMKLF